MHMCRTRAVLRFPHLLQNGVQKLHVLRLALDSVREEHVCLVRDESMDRGLLHTYTTTLTSLPIPHYHHCHNHTSHHCHNHTSLSAHAREGYSSHFVCVSLCVCVCVCHSTIDLEDSGLPGSETM